VLDLIEALSDLRSPASLENRLDEVFARLSCHAVIRAGKSLSNEEMEALLKSLEEADYPLTCPHGRPICVRITYEELERMFGRR
jgi:DNA mismatch repair protein MutL